MVQVDISLAAVVGQKDEEVRASERSTAESSAGGSSLEGNLEQDIDLLKKDEACSTGFAPRSCSDRRWLRRRGGETVLGHFTSCSHDVDALVVEVDGSSVD